jgi:transposase
MLTVEDYARIRRAYRDEMSIRAIARRFHHSRRKIREALREPELKGYTRRKPAAAPKLDPVKPVIDEILEADEAAPPKQRHTAAQIFRRLVAEYEYTGGYDQVRRYVAGRRRQRRETFIPLEHAPGQRAECDFGHIWVDFPEGRHQVPVLLVTWAYSYCPFAIALPTERTEAILHGLVEAFAFFGSVPREVWWDNPMTVAVTILQGRQRQFNGRYLALASHYNFEPLCCMPARGNEKPFVENRVKNLQRRWATPVPKADDLDDLNAYLLRCCLKDRERIACGQTETIARRFEEDRQAALKLPDWPFDACLSEPRKVDKYQTVAFDGNRYSVPRCWAFQTVTVKGYVHRVEVVAAGRVVAGHERSYASGTQVLKPEHYLATLSRKPACLDHAPVFRDWKLPVAFERLRRHLEEREGSLAGSRQYIRVLNLLATHSAERIARVVEPALARDQVHVDLIVERVEHPLQEPNGTDRRHDAGDPSLPQGLTTVEVPRPDLTLFDRFLSQGGEYHVAESEPAVAAEGQPQAVAAADHGGRI